MTFALAAGGAVVLAVAVLAWMPKSVSANSATVVTIDAGGHCTVAIGGRVYVGTGRRIGAPGNFIHYICSAALVSGDPVHKPIPDALAYTAGNCATPDGSLEAAVLESPGGTAQAACSNGPANPGNPN